MMAAKLGIELSAKTFAKLSTELSTELSTAFASEAEIKLFVDLEDILMSVETDMTIFYRRLADLPDDKSLWLRHLNVCFYDENEITATYQYTLSSWLERYSKLCDSGN
jgi:uncharacterized protein YdiU (UPF0061 family)